MRLPVNRCLTLAALILVAGCASEGERRPAQLPALPQNGPAADYPMVLGDPFVIDGATWTPLDQLNYDAVGYASVAAGDGVGVTAAHKTLPLPSYAEVTSLDNGRTILVRIERRGPMVNDTLVELSRNAAQELGISPGSRIAVRLRRTNPPEQERALLRRGDRVPNRMETPDGLLKVLRRKLTGQSPLQPPLSAPPATAKAAMLPKAPGSKPPPPSAPVADPQTAAPAQKGSLVVQAGAFSVEAGARKIAGQLGGSVSKPGKYWLVRIGPFANRVQAAAALEKARAAGYRDARIQHAD